MESCHRWVERPRRHRLRFVVKNTGRRQRSPRQARSAPLTLHYVHRPASEKRIGWWLLQQLAAFAHDLAHAFGLLVLSRQRPMDAHLRSLRLQAGARLLSQPPRPRTRALAGDVVQRRLCSKVNSEIATQQDE